MPAKGVSPKNVQAGRVREATADDIAAMVDLEMEVSRIAREKDFRYFIKNDTGIWYRICMLSARAIAKSISVRYGEITLPQRGS